MLVSIYFCGLEILTIKYKKQIKVIQSFSEKKLENGYKMN